MILVLVIVFAAIGVLGHHTFKVLSTDPREGDKAKAGFFVVFNTIILMLAFAAHPERIAAPIVFSFALSSLLTPAYFSAFRTPSVGAKIGDLILIGAVKILVMSLLAIPLVALKDGWWVVVLGVIGTVLFYSRIGLWRESGGSARSYIIAIVGLSLLTSGLSLRADSIGVTAKNWFKTLTHALPILDAEQGDDAN